MESCYRQGSTVLAEAVARLASTAMAIAWPRDPSDTFGSCCGRMELLANGAQCYPASLGLHCYVTLGAGELADTAVWYAGLRANLCAVRSAYALAGPGILTTLQRRLSRRLERDLALLINNRGGDTALWEIAPSAPFWRPPHQRGEFDGFTGRRERPNQ